MLLIDGKPIETKDAKLVLEAILKSDGRSEVVVIAAAALAVVQEIDRIGDRLERLCDVLRGVSNRL